MLLLGSEGGVQDDVYFNGWLVRGRWLGQQWRADVDARRVAGMLPSVLSPANDAAKSPHQITVLKSSSDLGRVGC